LARYRIAWLPGDGIGRDVMEAAKIVLDATSLDAEYVPSEVGWSCWEKYRNPLPDSTVEVLRNTDCCLFGAITSKPNVPGYRSPIVRIRELFDLYANVRPIKAYPGNPLNLRDNIDLVIFRENTEDLYLGFEYHPLPKEILKLQGMNRFKPDETALSMRIFTRKGCERIVRKAFEHAKKSGRKSVTVAHKANVIRKTDGMFLEVAQEISKQYPEITFQEANIDSLAAWLLKNPQSFEVIVTTNVFGDIISDVAAQLVGGLGFSPSANVGDEYALFEPTHGSAPKYAGKFVVNPTAMLLSVKLMLEWLGEETQAKKVESAVASVIKEGKVLTRDVGGNAGTLDVAREVVRKMQSQT